MFFVDYISLAEIFSGKLKKLFENIESTFPKTVSYHSEHCIITESIRYSNR